MDARSLSPDTRIEKLQIPSRIKSACRKKKLTFLSELLKLSPTEIWCLPNVGEDSVVEFVRYCMNRGVRPARWTDGELVRIGMLPPYTIEAIKKQIASARGLQEVTVTHAWPLPVTVFAALRHAGIGNLEQMVAITFDRFRTLRRSDASRFLEFVAELGLALENIDPWDLYGYGYRTERPRLTDKLALRRLVKFMGTPLVECLDRHGVVSVGDLRRLSSDRLSAYVGGPAGLTKAEQILAMADNDAAPGQKRAGSPVRRDSAGDHFLYRVRPSGTK